MSIDLACIDKTEGDLGVQAGSVLAFVADIRNSPGYSSLDCGFLVGHSLS